MMIFDKENKIKNSYNGKQAVQKMEFFSSSLMDGKNE